MVNSGRYCNEWDEDVGLNLDNLIWAVSTLAQAALCVMLLFRRVWKGFPFFCLTSAVFLLFDFLAYLILHNSSESIYFNFYLLSEILYVALDFLVLLELGASILRPYSAILPVRVNWLIGGAILCLGGLIWPFAVIPGFGNLPPNWHALIHIQQTEDILRILIFLLVIVSSRILAISSRSRELQIAAGLGFYSLISLALALFRTHVTTNHSFRLLNQLESTGYLITLLYWTISFARKEEGPKAVSPQMENLLRRVAGHAQAERESAVEALRRKNE